jgi:shikimate 5-dehydrogenase
MPVYGIQISEHEFKEALPILRELGLQFAAVTSPLKQLAFGLCSELSPTAKKLESVNTLSFDQNTQTWKGENTDLAGLMKYQEDIAAFKTIAVWGGGGTLAVLKEVFPQAHFYRGSNGEPLEEKSPKAPEFLPEVVVWGASRDKDQHFFAPPGTWKPQLVIDLNYRENSSGKEFALMTGARYISGEKMFFAQAEGQKKIWENYQ